MGYLASGEEFFYRARLSVEAGGARPLRLWGKPARAQQAAVETLELNSSPIWGRKRNEKLELEGSIRSNECAAQGLARFGPFVRYAIHIFYLHFHIPPATS